MKRTHIIPQTRVDPHDIQGLHALVGACPPRRRHAGSGGSVNTWTAARPATPRQRRAVLELATELQDAVADLDDATLSDLARRDPGDIDTPAQLLAALARSELERAGIEWEARR